MKCLAQGCTEEHGAHLFMCPRHWRMVPADLKAEINAAWRARKAAVTGDAAKYRPAADRHERAKRAALAFVAEGEATMRPNGGAP